MQPAFGMYHILKGRKAKQNSIKITCSAFTVQQQIGDLVAVSENETTLIKLAHNHFAIDFLIYQLQGSAVSRVLYFVQVSAKRYQKG